MLREGRVKLSINRRSKGQIIKNQTQLWALSRLRVSPDHSVCFYCAVDRTNYSQATPFYCWCYILRSWLWQNFGKRQEKATRDSDYKVRSTLNRAKQVSMTFLFLLLLLLLLLFQIQEPQASLHSKWRKTNHSVFQRWSASLPSIFRNDVLLAPRRIHNIPKEWMNGIL